MKHIIGLLLCLASGMTVAQVDTSFIYNTATPYGTLDIRLAKSATRYYYLEENITFSFRESSPGVKTNTFFDMTSWDSSPYTQGNLREKNGTASTFIMNYRLLFPVNHNPTYSPGYPLIIMMHGAGERANCWDNTCYWADRSYKPTLNSPAAPTTSTHKLLNNDHNLLHGGSTHLNARNSAGAKLPNDPGLASRAFPGFVLFPQNLNGWDALTTQDAIRLIRLIIKKYNIDPNRIYIHGLSNGAYGTYETVKRAPWLFAAMLTMSATSEASIISKGMAPKVAHIPVWTFQGGQDTAPTPAKTASIVKAFREAGADVRYSLYPNLGHGTWNTAYAEPDFFSWIRSKDKSRLHVFYNKPAICGTTNQGVKMGFAEGFLAYQWERNGQIIPEATSAEYVATQPGIYRARFSRKSAQPTEGDWNAWSQSVSVTLNNPAKAVIDVVGSTHMRGPDNNSYYNTVYLKAAAANDKYYWYKNDVLINIPLTTVDDTTRTYTITSSSSATNGVFTLVTKSFDDCPSPTSDGVMLYFGNSAPLLPDNNIPTNLAATPWSPSQIRLSWQDNSSIESYYEIWRRRPGGIFVLAGRAPSNITSFIDTGLEPSVTYEYKVRAINADGRSRYAPSDNISVNVSATTLSDTQPPGTPQNLVVVSNTENSISLRWTASTDNSGIRQYHIHYGNQTTATGSKVASYTLAGLPMNKAYYISVVAEDLAGNLSGASNTVTGTTYVSGLFYSHSTGAWTDLDEITNWNTPEFTGKVTTFTLAPRTQEDFFNFEFKGFLYIDMAGDYQLRTTSDDGSRLKLDTTVVIDNDGIHTNVTVTSPVVFLEGGPHAINVRYFEYSGSQTLTVQYKGPDTGFTWKTIPATALKSGSAPPSPDGSGGARIAENQPIPVKLNIFPRPAASEKFQITMESEYTAPAVVRIIDLMGRTYYTTEITGERMKNGTTVTPPIMLLNGVYFILVSQGNQTVKEKLVIRN